MLKLSEFCPFTVKGVTQNAVLTYLTPQKAEYLDILDALKRRRSHSFTCRNLQTLQGGGIKNGLQHQSASGTTAQTDKPNSKAAQYGKYNTEAAERETMEQGIIDRIKETIDCRKYLEKSQNGLYCCPVCDSGHNKNRTGAVKYYENTNSWSCHACNAGGDVIALIMKQQDIDFIQALEFAAMDADIYTAEYKNIKSIAQRTAGAEKSAAVEQKTTEAEKMADFTGYFNKCTEQLTAKEALSYLKSRGISSKTASCCGAGYDAEADPSGKGHKSRCIIFPLDAGSYETRRIDDNGTYCKQKNAGGHAGLFNKKALYDGSSIVFVVEGAFDAMSIVEAGGAAVSIGGKGNINKLVEQLQERPTEATLIISFDNDKDGGTRAAVRAAEKKLKNDLEGINVKSIIYNISGNEKDPNEALIKDRDAFTSAIIKAENAANPDALTEFWEKIQTDAYKPYITDLKFFDDLLGGGVMQQSLLLLLAPPATGKTTLCQQIAEAMAGKGKPVEYLNLEMSREQMLAKAISSRLNKRGIKKTAADILQGYRWSDTDKAEIYAEIEQYNATNYRYIKYNPAGVGNDIKQITEYLHRTGERAQENGAAAPVIILDYLHLVTSSDRTEPQELIKQTVKALKDYAIKYDTFVIAISATNRTSNSSGQITLSSGRDSSGIEYAGDYVLSLNYTEITDEIAKDAAKYAGLANAKTRNMTLRVLKHRLGGTDAIQLSYDAAGNRFSEWLPVKQGATFQEAIKAAL